MFRLRNTGRVPHEMALGQLRAGVTADSDSLPPHIAMGMQGSFLVD